MKTDVLGVRINSDRKKELLALLKTQLDQGNKIFIVTPYSESIVSAQTDPEYKALLNSADIVLPDGVGVQWAAAFLNKTKNKNLLSTVYYLLSTLIAIIFYPAYVRRPIPEKISGSDFVWDLAELAESRGESVYLLGGFENTSELAAKKLKESFPQLKIVGTYSGSPAERGLIEKINQSKADYLFVAFGPEKQEKWIHKNLPNLNVKLAIGLGGTFDYLAGQRPRAPRIWAVRGLEWLWRLLTQPWRAFRISRGVFGLIYYCFRYKLKYN
jgi:N-acetylglucosaminyldiphosphoundecaprenol N-acetyl-beta-D-mannosaminyltransferase